MNNAEMKLRKQIRDSATPERKAQLKKCTTCDFILTCWFEPEDENCRGLLKNYGGVK